MAPRKKEETPGGGEMIRASLTDALPLDWYTLAEAAIEHCDRVLLYGPPGTGKTFAASTVALAGRPLYVVPLTDETLAAELRGNPFPSAQGIEFLRGPLVRAMLEGGRIVVDEIGRASGDVLSLLLAAANDRASRRLTLPNGETIVPADRYQIIATSNDPPDTLPEPLRERFACILADGPAPGALAALPADLRSFAQVVTSPTIEPARRVALRAIRRYASLRANIPAGIAARIAFGAQAGEVIDALLLHTAPASE